MTLTVWCIYRLLGCDKFKQKAMQFSVISLILLCVVSRALTAPATKQHLGSDLKEQINNLQAQFKTIFQTIMKEKKLGNANTVDKRGMETNSIDKNKEKDLREKLKDVSEQLNEMLEQLNSVREKVHSMKESLGGNGDDDNGDFNKDRREVKSPSNDANSPACIKKSIVQERDPFILRIALTIMKRLHANEKRVYIEKLVNATADHLVAKMGTTHGVKDFHKRLLNAVLQLLKLRSILIIKTEGEFIDKLDTRKSRTLESADKNVDQSKVVQALEELLEGPLIKGFVSKAEEVKMIDSAVESLGEVFGLSKNRTKSVIHTMISHIEDDMKALEHGKEQGKPMTDDEKIKGLEKMVVDKVKENKLNVNEMKYLVKGLAAAVGARNKLSASNTKKLENKLLKGVHDHFAKIMLSGVNAEHKEDKGVKQDMEMLKKFEELHVPAGFHSSPLGLNNGDGKLEMPKRAKESDDENIKKTLLDNLKELKELASKLTSHSSPGLTEDTGNKVRTDAATNPRGSTKIVEQHNVIRGYTQAITAAPPISEPSANKGTNLDALLNELQAFITSINAHVPTSKNKTRDKVFVDAAKSTIGERKVDAGFKRKRGLFEIVADAISLIKSLKEKQLNSMKSRNAKVTTEAGQTTLPTKMTTEMAVEKAVVSEIKATLNPNVQSKKATPNEDVGGKANRSEISDVMKAETEKAEAEIQKELEKEQRAQEKEKLLEEAKNAEERKKEEKQEKKEKQEEEKEKQKQKEEDYREKQRQKQKENQGKEKEKQQTIQGNKTKKNDIPDESEAQIVADEKEIEKELDAQTNGKNKLIDKLQSLQTKQKSKEASKKENNELIKELDELFAKN